MTARQYRTILAILCAIAVIRVAATYRIFCATTDEPAHINSGQAWLTGRAYPLDLNHPPLAQVLEALPLAIAHPAAPESKGLLEGGNALLYHDHAYMKNVALSRIGNLLFLIVGIVSVAAWGRRLFDDVTGLVAAAIFSALPTVLAHAGVATTDMSVFAMLPAGWFVLERYLERSSISRAIQLGLVIALGCLGKFSFIPFFGLGALIIVPARAKRCEWRRIGATAPIVVVVTTFVIWAGYRFSFDTIAASNPDALACIATGAPRFTWIATHVPMPAPAFFGGIGAIAAYNHDGRLAFLFGQYSMRGWWYYFPVLLFYKTPLAFWLLYATGLVYIVRRRTGFVPALIGIAILLFVMRGHINIGVRHAAPVYAPLTLVAAFALTSLFRERREIRWTAAAAAFWFVISGAAAHPDYLAYFNEAAGSHPEHIAVDSNLDWGQDWMRFIEWQSRWHPGHVFIVWSGSIDLAQHHIDGEGLPPYEHRTGWIAVSETQKALMTTNGQDFGQPYAWLDAYTPVRRIGKSIRLYYIDR